LFAVVEVGADEAVAAFDVVGQVGQRAFFVERFELADRVLRLAFENLEQQRELRATNSSNFCLVRKFSSCDLH
jgi:hypothetical protein